MSRVPNVDLPVPLDLEGRLALVTGAAGGIGFAIARMLLRAGTRVLAIDKDGPALEEIESQIGWIPVVEDMAQAETEKLADELVSRYGPVELIVNNAGITTPHTFLSLEENEFDLVFRTNLKGPWFFTRGLVKHLIDAKRQGSIVFISSLHDSHVRLYPHYSVSKAGVAMLAKELAQELAGHNIRVNAISPGAIHTSASTPQERGRRTLDGLIPTGRMGTPEEIARASLFLLSDQCAGYITGANLRVDGGLSLHNWLMDL